MGMLDDLPRGVRERKSLRKQDAPLSAFVDPAQIAASDVFRYGPSKIFLGVVGGTVQDSGGELFVTGGQDRAGLVRGFADAFQVAAINRHGLCALALLRTKPFAITAWVPHGRQIARCALLPCVSAFALAGDQAACLTQMRRLAGRQAIDPGPRCPRGSVVRLLRHRPPVTVWIATTAKAGSDRTGLCGSPSGDTGVPERRGFTTRAGAKACHGV